MKNKGYVFISSHEGSEGAGLYSSELDFDTGKLTDFKKVADLDRAGLMVQYAAKNYLYAVGIEGLPATNQGCIAAYLIDPANGSLQLLSKQATGAGLPTFIMPSEDGKYLFQVSFSTAAGSVLKVDQNGTLTPSKQVLKFSGKGTNPIRQTKATPHCIIKHPHENLVLISDLGTDQISSYTLDLNEHVLVKSQPAQTSINLGAGPRIMRFSNDGKNLYIINELDNTISVYRYEGSGKLVPLQVISMLPSYADGSFTKQMAGEIRLHPNQQFVYATNRSTGDGDIDNIVVFKRELSTGMLTAIQFCETGKHPRHFNLDADGSWLFVSARDSDQIHRFAVNKVTGILTEIGEPVVFKQPWDLQFYTNQERI